MKKQILTFLLLVISSSSVFWAQVPSYVPTNGLVGWWPFNGNANDESGNGNNGTVNGATYTNNRDGIANSAIQMTSASGGYVDINLGAILPSEFTIFLWLRSDRVANFVGESFVCPGGVSVPMANSNQNWVIQAGNLGSNLGVGLSVGQNGVMVGEHANNVLVSRLSYNHSSAGFSSVVIVYRSDSTFLYVNGSLARSRPIHCLNNIKAISSVIRLGGSLYSPNFAGVIDDLAIWNRPLNGCEVSNISQSNSISVSIFNDIDQNCSQNAETGVEGVSVSLQPGNYIATSNTNGVASFPTIPDGVYTATIDTTNLNWSTSCPISQTLSIQNGVADCIGFGLTNNNPCTDPDVSIYAPFLRRCLSNQKVYVSACNQTTATGVLNASYVDVELDPLMTVTAASLPYTDQGNNIFRFQTGNINPGQCVNFNITTTVSCNALLGQTLCMDANLFPVEPCVLDTEPAPMATGVTPCNLPWDQSSLSVDGWCQGDSVYFTITNTGELGGGDMECYSPVRVYVDGVLTYFDSIMIQGGTTVTYSYFGNGQTWILQADQHPLHPGNSHPNAHVEACGDPTNWTPDIVNDFPQDDADPVVDIYCGLVTGSYDPNDKTGFPLGIGQSHDILPNTDLQYVIRFQNTGTDTAFTVVIRDTLDTDLNIFTVTPGVSSHNYTFRMYGPRVLEWTFENINLPDSTSNEPESHGFATFQVKQIPNLAAGTEINNSVGIYFDLNDPIITNTTLHTINPCINTITQTTNSSPFACSTYTAPNGQELSESGTYQIISQDANGCNTIHNITLSVSTFEATATLVGPNTLQASPGVSYQWINCATGQALSSATNPIVTVIDGEYAVIVNDGQCSDQSECITVNTAGIEEGELSLNLHPNPSNGLVIVEALGIEPSEYTILSMDGRILRSGMLHNGLTALDLNHFTNGTYLFNSNGKQIRFVISK
jgi:uncharacterized repeat protein (TIGR01451 family)